jgi:hypothetical protein
MIEVIAKLDALLNALRQDDIDALPPARRERLGQLLTYWGSRCNPPKEEPKAGVLCDLSRGERGE